MEPGIYLRVEWTDIPEDPTQTISDVVQTIRYPIQVQFRPATDHQISHQTLQPNAGTFRYSTSIVSTITTAQCLNVVCLTVSPRGSTCPEHSSIWLVSKVYPLGNLKQ